MPPKKKSSSKAPAKEKTPTLINGLTKEEMPQEQLDEVIARLREELDREREERNYFQLERDLIQSLSRVPERRLAEAAAQLCNLEAQMEEDEAHHQVEVKVYQQKMKHLLFEHQNSVCELEAEREVAAEALLKGQGRAEEELHQEVRELLVDSQRLQYGTLVEELKTKHREEAAAAKRRWEEHLAELAETFPKRLQLMQQQQESSRAAALSDRQHAWNSHVAALREHMDRTFRTGPGDVRDRKVDVLRSTTSISEARKVQERRRAALRCLLQDNKRLAELISKEGNKQSAGAQRRINYYSGKTDALERNKMAALAALRPQQEALQRRFNKLQLEKEEIQKAFLQGVERTTQEAHVESREVEEEVEALLRSVEETEARLHSVLSASNLNPGPGPGPGPGAGRAPENSGFSSTALRN